MVILRGGHRGGVGGGGRGVVCLFTPQPARMAGSQISSPGGHAATAQPPRAAAGLARADGSFPK